jgi:hypothetical protein
MKTIAALAPNVQEEPHMTYASLNIRSDNYKHRRSKPALIVLTFCALVGLGCSVSTEGINNVENGGGGGFSGNDGQNSAGDSGQMAGKSGDIDQSGGAAGQPDDGDPLACTVGQTRCVEGVSEQCSADTGWDQPTECAFVCREGSCAGECFPGEQPAKA